MHNEVAEVVAEKDAELEEYQREVVEGRSQKRHKTIYEIDYQLSIESLEFMNRRPSMQTAVPLVLKAKTV